MQYRLISITVIFLVLVFLSFGQILSTIGSIVVLIISGFFVNINNNWEKWKTIQIQGHEKASLLVSKPIILCVRYSQKS
jgi:hypothetical protein